MRYWLFLLALLNLLACKKYEAAPDGGPSRTDCRNESSLSVFVKRPLNYLNSDLKVYLKSNRSLPSTVAGITSNGIVTPKGPGSDGYKNQQVQFEFVVPSGKYVLHAEQQGLKAQVMEIDVKENSQNWTKEQYEKLSAEGNWPPSPPSTFDCKKETQRLDIEMKVL